MRCVVFLLLIGGGAVCGFWCLLVFSLIWLGCRVCLVLFSKFCYVELSFAFSFTIVSLPMLIFVRFFLGFVLPMLSYVVKIGNFRTIRTGNRVFTILCL